MQRIILNTLLLDEGLFTHREDYPTGHLGSYLPTKAAAGELRNDIGEYMQYFAAAVTQVHAAVAQKAIWSETEEEPRVSDRADVVLGSGVLAFCFRQGIQDNASLAVSLVKRCFAESLMHIFIEPERDPDTDEEWLTLNITVNGTIRRVLNSYNNYVNKWVSLVPRSDRYKVRLAYSIKK